MIVVRNVFQMKFGQAKDVKSLIPEGRQILRKHGIDGARFMTDVTGPFYTLVMELHFESMTSYEESQEVMRTPEFGAWYGKFMTHIDSGQREMFLVVE